MKIILATLLAATAVATANTILITEINSNGAGGDFFEIHNYGATPVDLTGWKWTDDEANFNGTTKPVTFGAVTIPAGGILVVVQAANDTAFRAAWNDLDPAIATAAIGGPGLGQNDAVVLFNAAGDFVAGLNYGTSDIAVTQGDTSTVILPPLTKLDGTPANGGHAPISAGGANQKASAIWDPNSGTANPRYTFASVGVLNAYAQSGDSATIGSPGLIGSGPVGNQPPAFTTPPQAYAVENFNISEAFFFVQAVDPNPGQTVTLSLRSGPAWLSLNTATGRLSGVPNIKGNFTAVIRATDNGTPVAFSEQTLNITVFAESAPVLLNEYNAVTGDKFLAGGDDSTPTPADTHFGRIPGNGGEWVEWVVVGDGNPGDTVDMRGWKIDVLGDLGTRTIVLAQHPYWANVAAGTLLTFIVNNTANGGLDTEIHKTSTLHNNGLLWSNFWIFDPVFIDQDASTFNNRLGISNSDTQFILRDDADEIVFGPAGEGIATGGEPPALAGVNSEEVLKLETDPQPFIDPYYSPYNDGTTSTFGSPNVWSGGTSSQSFADYQTTNSPPRFTTTPVTQAYGSYSYTIATSDPNGHSVTLSTTDLPDFLTLTPGAPGTATLANNRPLTLEDAGFYTIQLVANDGQAAHNLTYQAFTLTVFHDSPTVILNEYNAVSSDNFLGGTESAAVDTHFGRVLGNGGDWVEFVVVGDGVPGTVDLRGWTIEIGTSQGGLPFEMRDTLTLSQDVAWSAVRAGTILTFTESNTAGGGMDTAINQRDRSTTLGDSWSNFWMGDTTYIALTGATIEGDTVTGISIDNDDTQFLIKDADGNIVFGPAGEGIAPISGISSEEIFELEGDPSPGVAPFITSDDTVEPPREGYDDGGSGSTFGWPNEWKFGIAGPTVLQDFTAYINEAPTSGFDLWVSAFPDILDPSLTADPDGDDRNNWEEYVFGGDPTVADAAAPQVFLNESAEITWEFDLRDDPEVLLVVKRSSDLVGWTPVGASEATIEFAPHPVLPGFHRVTLTADPSVIPTTDDRLFLRAEVAVPES